MTLFPNLQPITLAVLSGAIVLAASSTMTRADDTGFASIHTMRRVGSKTCFADHPHGGSGSGASRKLAEMQAIKSWYGYTAGEYGSDWASLGKAVGRSMNCTGSGASWSCDLTATPCK